ncbi:hypothetical protein BGZ72_010093 [Mortierella alpina]|nr:hypothetical protein BGZ72_010093 [Mortierella alpina]
MGLIRNLTFIRTVELNTDNVPISHLAHGLPPGQTSSESAVIPNTRCTNLRQLKLSSLDADLWLLARRPSNNANLCALATLLNHNPHLTHLTLPDTILDSDDVVTAISTLRHLQRLAITTLKMPRGTQSTLRLLQACLPLPDLTELIMDFCLPCGIDDEDSGLKTLSSPRKDRSRLDFETIIKKSLLARFCKNPAATSREDDRNCASPLMLPLLTSGLLDLESCTIPWVSECPTSWDVEKIVREYCPNLKHLTYRSLAHESKYDTDCVDEDDEFLRAFIRGCSGLQSFVSSDFGTQDIFHEQHIISDLVSRHCDTLREIELTDCWLLPSSDQQAILSRCKQLRRFYVHSIYNIDDRSLSGSTGIRFTDVSRSDWACMELRELCVTLNRDFDAEVEHQDDLAGDNIEAVHARSQYEPGINEAERNLLELAAERVYTQIGRLRKLEKLTIDIDRSEDTIAVEWDYEWELTLNHGKLGELADLKNLRSLTLEGDFWSRMGQPEVEFMHEHWPMLEEIVLFGRVSKLRTLSHWQWLLDKRPQMRFITHERTPTKNP